MEKALTVEETAELLRVSVYTVRRNAKVWGGYKLRGSRRWLFDRRRLKEAIEV